jgi:hypothetical protein
MEPFRIGPSMRRPRLRNSFSAAGSATTLPLNGYLLRSSLFGSLGGLLFGFDTAVISWRDESAGETFTLSPRELHTLVHERPHFRRVPRYGCSFRGCSVCTVCGDDVGAIPHRADTLPGNTRGEPGENGAPPVQAFYLRRA